MTFQIHELHFLFEFLEILTMNDKSGGERSIVSDVKEWVSDLQASVVEAGQRMIEDISRLQEVEHSRLRFIRNKSLNVFIKRHFGFIEIEVT